MPAPAPYPPIGGGTPYPANPAYPPAAGYQATESPPPPYGTAPAYPPGPAPPYGMS